MVAAPVGAGRVVVVTGASGFVGRRLLPQLVAAGFSVIAISRNEVADTMDGVRWLTADLRDRTQYDAALRGVDAVIHLASVTGKARPDVYREGIVGVTEQLLASCVAQAVPRLVYVSSIAAGFRDLRHYHYGHAKLAAERAVRASGLSWVIVRPTMIFGDGSPVETALERIATLPVVPLFGGGRALVQPVSVDAVVDALVTIISQPHSGNASTDLAGPVTWRMDALLDDLRKRRGLPPARLRLPIPLVPLRAVLASLEPLLLPVLPFTAGQLTAFANDCVAQTAAVSPIPATVPLENADGRA